MQQTIGIILSMIALTMICISAWVWQRYHRRVNLRRRPASSAVDPGLGDETGRLAALVRVLKPSRCKSQARAGAAPAADTGRSAHTGECAASAADTDPSVHTGAEAECCICLDYYHSGDAVVKLPCGHVFHHSCLERWLLQAQAFRDRACPLCKADPLVMRPGEAQRPKAPRSTIPPLQSTAESTDESDMEAPATPVS